MRKWYSACSKMAPLSHCYSMIYRCRWKLLVSMYTKIVYLVQYSKILTNIVTIATIFFQTLLRLLTVFSIFATIRNRLSSSEATKFCRCHGNRWSKHHFGLYKSFKYPWLIVNSMKMWNFKTFVYHGLFHFWRNKWNGLYAW